MALRVFGRYLLYGGATASVCYFVYRRFWIRKPEDDFYTDCDNFLDIPDCDYCDHAHTTPSLDYINVDRIVVKEEKKNIGVYDCDVEEDISHNTDFCIINGITMDNTDDEVDKLKITSANYDIKMDEIDVQEEKGDIEVNESDVEEDKSHNTDLCKIDGISMDDTNMVIDDVEKLTSCYEDIEKTVEEVVDRIISKVEKEVDSAGNCESFEERQSNNIVRKKKGRRKFKGLRKFFKRLSCTRKAADDE